MIYAVGVVELKSIAKGVEACDHALKAANIRLVSAHAACPGKYEIVLTGELADVQTAVDMTREQYSPYIVDAVMMGRIDETVIRALLGAQNTVQRESLGIIETFSAASAIKAADTAVKSANVEVGFMDRFCGSLILTGGLAEVQTAVESVVKFFDEVLGFKTCEIHRS